MPIMTRKDRTEIRIHMSDQELLRRLDPIRATPYLDRALEQLKELILDEMVEFLKEETAVVGKLRHALESAVIHIGEIHVPSQEKRDKVLEEACGVLKEIVPFQWRNSI